MTKAKKERVSGKWTALHETRVQLNGRSTICVTCECGASLRVYVWSFAGSGKVCSYCNRHLQGTI